MSQQRPYRLVVFIWMLPLIPCSPDPAAAGQNEAQEESGKQKKDKRLLEEEFDTLEDADFPELVGVDDQGEIMDELAFLREEDFVELPARHRQPIAQSASAITLLTREELERSSARTLPELLRVVPNMDVTACSPLWYEIGARAGGAAIGTDMVLLLVDGRDSTIEFLGFPTWTAQHFSLDEVKRVEVIRGPGSALYGANAFSGVVSVTTFGPDEGPRASASARAGEHGETELNVRARGRLGPLDLAVGGGLAREDLWTQRTATGRSLLRGRLQGQLKTGADTTLSFEAGAYRLSGEARSSLSEMKFEDVANFLSQVRLDHHRLRLQAVYERYQMDVDFRLHVSMGDTVLLRLPLATALVDKTAFIAQHSVEVAHNHLTYGAEYLFHHYYSALFFQPVMNESRLGIFVQDEISIDEIVGELTGGRMPTLILTAGMRADWNNVSDWELSPRATLVFQPHPDHSFRVGLAHAFLKPKLMETRFHIHMEDVADIGIDQLRYTADPDLGNETIDSLEAGWRGDFFGGRLQVGLDFAYNWYRNPIVMDIDEEKATFITIGDLRFPDPSKEGLVVKNTEGGVNGYGLELQLLTRPADCLRFFFAFGYRQIHDVGSSSHIDLEPEVRFAAGLDLSLPRGWTASLRTFHRSAYRSRAANPQGFFHDRYSAWLEGGWLVNARLAWRLSVKPVEVDVGVEAFNLAGNRLREMAGYELPSRSDWGGERLDRRVVLFVQGRI